MIVWYKRDWSDGLGRLRHCLGVGPGWNDRKCAIAQILLKRRLYFLNNYSRHKSGHSMNIFVVEIVGFGSLVW